MTTHGPFGRFLAALLSVSLTACATSGGYRVATPAETREQVDTALLAEYVQKLPLGEDVRVDRASGRTIRGTLLKATDQVVVVQPRTRIAVPPVQVPLSDVIRIAPDHRRGTSLAKAIGAGVAAGAAGALAVVLILVSIYD